VGYIEGIDRNQVSISSLNELVKPDAAVRVIDLFIEVVDIKNLGFSRMKPLETGRPAYPPEMLCKLYVYGYENGIRSSRKLERETYRNIEVMWLMNSLKPDHKTISEFRRENIRPLQKLFREFVKLCCSWELVGGELIAFDGTKFKACNNKKNNFSRKKLDARLAGMEKKIKKYMDEIDSADKAEEFIPSVNTVKLQELLKRKEKYEEYKKQLEATGENEISIVDPDARLMGNNRGGVEMAYNVQSAVDGKHDLIIEYDVSMNPSDHNQLSRMVKKVKRKLKLKRFIALADKGYYNGPDLSRLKKFKVKAIVSRQKPPDSKELPKEFRSDKFVYDKETDTYTCPMGETLKSPNMKTAKRRNFFNKTACAACQHTLECTPGKRQYRTVTRSQYADIYEETDKQFTENTELYKRRQQIVEHPFGTIKHSMHGGQFLLLTRRKVCAEVALLFLGYNLKRVLNVLGFEELMARLSSLLFLVFRLMRYIGQFSLLTIATL
jgi:transposase